MTKYIANIFKKYIPLSPKLKTWLNYLKFQNEA